MLLHNILRTQGAMGLSISALYWRLLSSDVCWTQLDGYGPYFQAIYSIKMFESADASGTDLACYKSSYGSMNYYGVGLAFDGDDATYWQTNSGVVPSQATTPQWAYVNMVAPVTVRSIQIMPYAGGYHAKKYQIQYSDDATSWTTLKEISTASSGAVQTFSSLQ